MQNPFSAALVISRVLIEVYTTYKKMSLADLLQLNMQDLNRVFSPAAVFLLAALRTGHVARLIHNVFFRFIRLDNFLPRDGNLNHSVSVTTRKKLHFPSRKQIFLFVQ